MSDLFDDLTLIQKARLRQLGWVELSRWGTVYWQSPHDGAWLKLEQALEWLAAHDQQKEGGQ